MHVYYDTEMELRLSTKGRHHPWEVTTKTPDGRYVDLKGNPELIVGTLEDLKYVSGTSAEHAVVSFISWANGPNSAFETNDFGLRPLKVNDSGVSPSKLEMLSRVTLLFRDLRLNTRLSIVRGFLSRVERELRVRDAEFVQACWSLSTWPHLFLDLRHLCEDSEGHCSVFQCWAWGDNESEVHVNFERAFHNLQKALVIAATVTKP